MARLRVLHAIHDFLPRHRAGSEIYAFDLASALAARHDVWVLCAEYDPSANHGGLRWRTEGTHRPARLHPRSRAAGVRFLQEALMNGVTIVAAAVGGIPETVPRVPRLDVKRWTREEFADRLDALFAPAARETRVSFLP